MSYQAFTPAQAYGLDRVLCPRFIDALNDVAAKMGIQDPKSEFVEYNVKTDDGITHYRLQQVYKGIPIYGQQIVLNVKEDGTISGCVGGYLPGLDMSVEPVISIEEAKRN